MTLDATTLGAFLGFFGLIVTTIAGVFVATKTNKAEKAGSSLKALEDTRDEVYEGRLLLRDEQISLLRLDLQDCRAEIEKLRVEIRSLREVKQ